MATFVVRFLDPEFHNDHFTLISGGRQILHGEMPFRDFLDPGHFLQYYASAAAQVLFGYNLLGEALLDITLLSLGAALTFWLACEIARSTFVGLLTATLAAATFPYLYNYHKVFFLVLALLLCWRYVDLPTPRRLLWLALATALAFMFRQDLGLYSGIAGVTTLLAVHWHRRRMLARRLALYTASTTAALLPFFVVLQANGGVLDYFRSVAVFYRAEALRTKTSLLIPFDIGIRVDFAPLLAAFQPPEQPPAPLANVRWKPGVRPEQRAELEARYGLANPRFDESDPRQRTWQYNLTDTTPTNIRALVRDRHVEDTHGIDRVTFQVQQPPRSSSWDLRQLTLPLPSVHFSPGSLLQRGNAVAWLYYLFLALPFLATLTLFLKRSAYASGTLPPVLRNEWRKVLPAALLCAVAGQALLRWPIPNRLPDIAAPAAVLGAWLLKQWVSSGRTTEKAALLHSLSNEVRDETARRRSLAVELRPLVRYVVAILVIVPTTLSVGALASIPERVERIGVLRGPSAVAARAGDVLARLTVTPSSSPWPLAEKPQPGPASLARYVNECTYPEDRLLVTWFAPTYYFYSDRAFAGGRFWFLPGYWSSPEDQQRTVALLQSQSVPIIISEIRGVMDFEVSFDFAAAFPIINDYLMARYVVVREAPFAGDPVAAYKVYRILVDRQLTPTRIYQPLDLPCFR